MKYSKYILLFVLCVVQEQVFCMDTDILILGGGIAGISAAKTLSEKGLTDFIILEARDSIGGRMRQENIAAGVKVETGANWIQGVDPSQPELHPIFALAQECGGLEGVYSDYDSLIVYNSTGTDISDEPSLRYDDYSKASDYAEETSLKRQAKKLPPISVRDGLSMGGWTPQTSEDNWVEWFKFDFCFAQTANDSCLYQLPKAAYEEYGNYERTTDYFVTDQDGYGSLVTCLADQFLDEDDVRLHLEAVVTKIIWSTDSVCVEVTERGEAVQYCAKYAIVTFSVGVLQARAHDLFQPSLPESKLEVINSFTMVHFLKVYTLFESVFWDSVEYIGYVDDTRGYFPSIQPLNQFLPNNLAVLLFTITEGEADRIVRQPEANTIAEIQAILSTIYNTTIPEPIKILVPDWDINPFFLGTYPDFTLYGSEILQERPFADPVGRIYFSGEAASRNQSGLVQGAFLAGIDSANAVIIAMESSAFGPTGNMLLLALLAVIALIAM